MTRVASGLASSLLVALLAGVPASAAEPPGRAEEVAALLAGTYDSKARSESDPKSPPAARLVAVRVPKSRLGDGAPVLYVEEALLSAPNRPSRLRFCRVEETADGGVVVRVLAPKEALAVSGKWRDPSDLALFGPHDVVERIACAIRLKRSDGGWSGSTEGKGCPSARGGARYVVTRLTLAPGRIESWERGYDRDDRQVWGSAEGPTVYEKRSEGPPVDAAK